MKRKQLYLFLILWAVFTVLMIGIAYFRSGSITLQGLIGFPLSSLIGFVVYTILTAVCLYKFKAKLPPKYILLAIWLGVGLFETSYRCISFESSLVSLPNTLLWWLGILCGYLYWKISRRWLKAVVVVIPFIFTLWMSYYGYSMWIHKLNFGTFTGKVERTVTSDYSLFDDRDEEIRLSQFKGKYVVLDFWSKYCGLCYGEMPTVENFYNRYKQNPDILIAGVFACKQEDDRREGAFILKNEGYTYPTFSTNFDSSILKGFGIKSYPAVVILSPDGEMIYFGRIEGAVKLIDFIFQ